MRPILLVSAMATLVGTAADPYDMESRLPACEIGHSEIEGRAVVPKAA